MYKYCVDRNILCTPIGKLVVATSKQQTANLHRLMDQSHRNGYRDVRFLSEHDVMAMEPCVKASGGGLWSPQTGIVDSHNLMLHLLGDAEDHGASFAANSPVDDALIAGENDIRIFTAGIWLSCEIVVNCAGLWADRVAALFHRSSLQHGWSPPRQYFAKGNYFSLDKKSPFQHLIYPLPDPQGGLGVHATLDANKRVKFGPDVEWISLETTADQISYTPNKEREGEFYQSIRSYWPDLEDNALSVDYAGVRPKLLHPGTLDTKRKVSFRDFVIAGQEHHRVSGLVHLLGIESPGLTSCFALADYVSKLIK